MYPIDPIFVMCWLGSYFLMLLNICAWNVKCLNDPVKQKAVAKFLSKEDIHVPSLLETKVLNANHSSVFNHVLYNCACHSNYDYATLGRV